MNASDWIAVASAGVALVALVVSYRALQLQSSGAKGSARQQFDELMHQLGRALDKWLSNGDGDSPQGQAGSASNGEVAQGEIQTLALDADALVNPPASNASWVQTLSRLWNPRSSPLQPNWYEAVVLASSFAEVWDIERAGDYWKLAKKMCHDPKAKVGASAQIFTYRSYGQFCYEKNTEDDLKEAREIFDSAVKILQPETNGPDVTNAQNQETRFQQAQEEDKLSKTAEAAWCLREAWEYCMKVRAPWRCQQAKSAMASFVVYGGNPSRFDRHGLPQELTAEAGRLQAQQQMPIADQLTCGGRGSPRRSSRCTGAAQEMK
jgi:hypothetical protein